MEHSERGRYATDQIQVRRKKCSMADELTGSVSWEWLAGCLTCDKPHELRPPRCECGKQRCNEPWTWAAEDGHAYRPRVRDVEGLRTEYLNRS